MIQFEIKAPIGREYDGNEYTIKCMDPGVTFAVELFTVEPISPWRERAIPYKIPEGSTATLRVTRPDRAYTNTKTTIEGGIIFCPVHPYSVATPGKCSADVAVYGPDGNRITSATFHFFVDRECAPTAGENAPAYVDSIQGLIEFVEQAADRAEAAADRAESSGGGNGGNPPKDGITPHIGANGNWYIGTTDTGVSAEGEDGEDGGHYTPVVTQPTTDTIKIAFTPIKSTMPAVASVTVNLPTPSAEEHPDNPVVDGITVGGENGVRFDSEGEPSAPILALYGAHGAEPVRVSHVAPAQEDGEAVPLGQVKQLVKEHSGQNVTIDTTLTQSGQAADAKAVGDALDKLEEKIPTKPEDIGAQPKGNYLTSAPVTSVNGKTGAVQLSAEQVGADPKGTAAAAVSAHNTNNAAHSDIRQEIKTIREQLATFLDVDEETLNELSELIARIVANQTSIEQLTTGKVNVADIIDNLTTNVANKPLSSAQGVALKALIDGLSTGKLDASKLQSAINDALTQAKTSGEFDGKDGYTPKRDKDYWTPADKAEIEAWIATELTKRGQLKPEFANSIEECTDTSKLYVPPDGYIYAWMMDDGYTNLVPTSTDKDGAVYNGVGYQDGHCLDYSATNGTGSVTKQQAGYAAHGFIPYTWDGTIRMSGVTWDNTNRSVIAFFDKNKKPLGAYVGNGYVIGVDASFSTEGVAVQCLTDKVNQSVTAENGVTTFNLDFMKSDTTNTSGVASGRSGAHIRYVRISANGSGEDMVVTIDEEIIGNGPAGYGWRNTGHAFVPADYEDRIVELEKGLGNLGETIQAALEEFAKTDSFDATAYGLPVLAMDGNCAGMTKDDYVSLSYAFMGNSGTVDVKKQGSSSVQTGIEIGAGFDDDLGGLFNFTLKFDEAFEAKAGWGAQKKYCFKANAIDHSHARNVCSCKLWGEIVKSRADAPTELSGLVNGGAIDGFPIVVILNGRFYALGTFNIPKDGWMFGSPKAILCADDHTDATQFKALATLDGDFELEYVEDENDADWVLPSINRAIQAVMDSDGTNLDATVGQYIDIPSATDYYIHTVDENGDDGVDKNYILVTFDKVKWYFSVYDRDTGYGLYWNGKRFTSPEGGITYAKFASMHKLMELIYTHQKSKLKDRAIELRNSIKSEIHVGDVFTAFAAGIPAELLAQNCRRWPLLRSTNASNTAQILNWYRLRRIVIDKEIDAM